ncbi:MAG: hypothetical protein IJ527_10180 [Prevotella sp.]|nr:hypothetical protein [Prevotella sp.]
MKQVVHLIIICVALLVFGSCGGGRSVRLLPHVGDTPYQQDSILMAYAVNPDRALTLLDSALLLGNISDYRGQFIRARIYSMSLAEQHQDSAILICTALLSHDSVRHEPAEQENILDVLIVACRAKHDNEQYLHWATQKAELCRKQGEETERWRTEADIGLLMTQLGQVNEGLSKLDEAISHLDAPGSIDRMDAFIVAVKRKINALNRLHRYSEVTALAQRILDRLDHYESHAKDYAEDSYRLSWSDNPSDRDRYLDFSRAQAWGFLAQSYSLTPDPSPAGTPPRSLSPKGEGSANRELAKKYLALFDQSGYGQTFSARRMIAPTQMALGMYDEALTTYDEVEHRMAGDTLNDEYAVILRSRAIAAHAKGHTAEAYDWQTRYAHLSKAVSDSLHKSEAHEYAVRYHLQEEQLKTQEAEAASRLKSFMIAGSLLLLVVAVAVSVYYYRQKRIISEKNRALVRMINGTPPALPDDDEDPGSASTAAQPLPKGPSSTTSMQPSAPSAYTLRSLCSVRTSFIVSASTGTRSTT